MAESDWLLETPSALPVVSQEHFLGFNFALMEACSTKGRIRMQGDSGGGSTLNVTNPATLIVETSIRGKALSSFMTADVQARVANRWADGVGSGIQGPPSDALSTAGRQIINNSSRVLPSAKSTFGGMLDNDANYPRSVFGDSGPCSWHIVDCGPNNEPFTEL